MKKRNYILLAAFLGVVTAGVIAWLTLRSGEPVYQGKTLSAWLEQYVANLQIVASTGSGPSLGDEAEVAKRDDARAQADTAITHIGTNALPYLVQMAGAKDSPLKEKLYTILSKQSVVPIHIRTARHYHLMAEFGFGVLRWNAEPALPGLIRLLHGRPTSMDAHVASVAGDCLHMIGEPAVPYLLPLLTNDDPDVRYYAARTARSIAPRLTYLIGSDENETNRCRMIGELAEIGWTDPEVEATLTNALSDKSISVRRAATNALERLDAAEARTAGAK